MWASMCNMLMCNYNLMRGCMAAMKHECMHCMTIILIPARVPQSMPRRRLCVFAVLRLSPICKKHVQAPPGPRTPSLPKPPPSGPQGQPLSSSKPTPQAPPGHAPTVPSNQIPSGPQGQPPQPLQAANQPANQPNQGLLFPMFIQIHGC